MSQWWPGQPGTHPDLPPSQVEGDVAIDAGMSDILIAEVLTLVHQERKRQIEKLGYTRAHDNTHQPLDFVNYIEDRLKYIRSNLMTWEEKSEIEREEASVNYYRWLIQIAALACAAFEASSSRS
jgi:hypothetical protein